jgi:hypothetical protein
MQEDIQGILPKRKVESHHTQKVWTNITFRVSTHALVKKKEKERVEWQKRGYAFCSSQAGSGKRLRVNNRIRVR